MPDLDRSRRGFLAREPLAACSFGPGLRDHRASGRRGDNPRAVNRRSSHASGIVTSSTSIVCPRILAISVATVTSQHNAGKSLIPEAIGEHQGLDDAAQNVGKPSQCAVLVGCHRFAHSPNRPAHSGYSPARESEGDADVRFDCDKSHLGGSRLARTFTPPAATNS